MARFQYCIPREAHGAAGCPPAAHGHHMGQISMCSHGGTRGAAAHGYPCRSTSGQTCSPWRAAHCGEGGLGELLPLGTHVKQCLKYGPCGLLLEKQQSRSISLGRTTLYGRDPMLKQGKRETTEEWHRLSVMD